MFVNVIHAMDPSTALPKPSARDRRATDTRARICDASLAIVTSEGFEALTMQRLGHELGCAPGGIYRYFPSKSDIVLALLQGVIASLCADIFAADVRLRASRAASALSPGERGLTAVLIACETFIALRAVRPAHAQLIGLALGDPKALVDAPEGPAAPHLDDIARVALYLGQSLDAAATEGLIHHGDTRLRVVGLFGALQGVLLLTKLERLKSLSLDATALAREVLVTTVTAWGAPSALVTRCHRLARRIASAATAPKEPSP